MRRHHLGEALAGESLTYLDDDDDENDQDDSDEDDYVDDHAADYKRHYQQNYITCDEEEKDADNDI